MRVCLIYPLNDYALVSRQAVRVGLTEQVGFLESVIDGLKAGRLTLKPGHYFLQEGKMGVVRAMTYRGILFTVTPQGDVVKGLSGPAQASNQSTWPPRGVDPDTL